MSLLVRFKIAPVMLFRLQPTKKIALLEQTRQEARNRFNFDFKLHEDGKVHPTVGDKYVSPNGASLAPAGPALSETFTSFKGKYIYTIPKDTPIPDELILIHECFDDYSLQTAVICTEKELNERLKKFFEKMPMITREEFKSKYSLY